jgi:hypothetical protein
MHTHAGGQTDAHTAVTAFLLTAEQMIGNAVKEVYVRDGHSRVQQRLVEIENEIYELRLDEIKRHPAISFTVPDDGIPPTASVVE